MRADHRNNLPSGSFDSASSTVFVREEGEGLTPVRLESSSSSNKGCPSRRLYL